MLAALSATRPQPVLLPALQPSLGVPSLSAPAPRIVDSWKVSPLAIGAIPSQTLSLATPKQLGMRPITALGQVSQALNPPQPAPGKVTLDLLTLNAYGLPKPIGKDIPDRVARISSTLGAYQIVGLQETFDKATHVIGKQVAAEGFQAYRPTDRRVITSGLTMLSQYPILKQGFKPFVYASHADALAKKGVTFIRVLVPGVGPVDVYNTHYQAQGDKPQGFFKRTMSNLVSFILPGFDMPKEFIRLHDNDIMASFIQENEAGYPTFVMGDFNTTETKRPYADLLAKTGLKDSFREANPGDPGYTSDGELNPLKDSKSRSRLDYIFYKPGQAVDIKVVQSKLSHNQAINGKFVSDHFGVHTQFELAPKVA